MFGCWIAESALLMINQVVFSTRAGHPSLWAIDCPASSPPTWSMSSRGARSLPHLLIVEKKILLKRLRKEFSSKSWEKLSSKGGRVWQAPGAPWAEGCLSQARFLIALKEKLLHLNINYQPERYKKGFDVPLQAIAINRLRSISFLGCGFHIVDPNKESTL